MDDYIKRKDVHLALDSHYFTGELSLKETIDSVSAANVRPVVRGRNICDTVNRHCEFKCSICGVELLSVYGGDNDFGFDGGYFNFCPFCGAEMERGAEE